jgi:(p)ppGpp synthase/HD superfamily hydrolase
MTTTLESRAAMGAGPLSERFDDALLFTARHHRTQLRKGSQVPYMSHLMSVSALVMEHGGTEGQAIAALLHDAVEDAPAGQGGAVLAEIRERFGDAVADMVAACSDRLNDSGERKGTWQERKQAYVDGLPHKALDALLVTAADKTHNGLCIAADVRRYGPGFWSTFNASRDELLWYYTSVERTVAERLPDSSIAEALHRAVEELIAASALTEAGIPTRRRSRPNQNSPDGRSLATRRRYIHVKAGSSTSQPDASSRLEPW